MKIIVLDLETTGLKPQFDEIVELGIVSLDLETGEITTLFNQLFNSTNVSFTAIQKIMDCFQWVYCYRRHLKFKTTRVL
jgi:DNA polymerase III epsilon subunit-like protein